MVELVTLVLMVAASLGMANGDCRGASCNDGRGGAGQLNGRSLDSEPCSRPSNVIQGRLGDPTNPVAERRTGVPERPGNQAVGQDEA